MIRETRARILILKVGLLAFFLIVVLRLVQLQIIDAGKYQEIGRKQYEVKLELPAQRGSIYDRNGRTLVTNSLFISFGADPVIVGDRATEVAERFARVFEKPRAAYLERLNATGKHFVWLERRVRPALANQIGAGDMEGVVEIPEPRRLYHYDHVAGHVLGFTDVDNRGLSGLELELDSLLRGRDGRVIMQRDGLGRRRPSVDYPRTEPTNGNAAFLTIEIESQAIAEEELRKGVERNKAESGLVVMMDPATGEILAMSTYPSLNPAEPSTVSPTVARNKVITDMFEPGSVFKVVTAAAALERNLVRPDQRFDAEQGEYVVRLPNGKVRNTITDTHQHGIISFQEAMEVSSNIVMAKVSDLIGAEAFYTMARNFGFGTESGISLPGEARGELKKPAQWSGTTLNTMAYGYEVGATPLQIIAAYAAVANGGRLMKPFIVKKIVAPDNSVLEETKPEQIRRVVSKQTAETLTRMLCGVVERGTGMTAKVAGISVAGKTGTARKFVDGRYVPGSYIASFIGYFPAEQPAAVCLVMLDNPSDHGYTGALVCAPIFRAIAEKVHAISPQSDKQQTDVIANQAMSSVPDVLTLKIDAAKATLLAGGFDVATRGEGRSVLSQSPEPGSKAARGTTVTLTTAGSVLLPQGFTLVPDVRGMPIRRAVNRLAMQQLDVAIAGSGTVRAQSPRAGEQVKAGSRVSIRCEPRDLSMVTMY